MIYTQKQVCCDNRAMRNIGRGWHTQRNRPQATPNNEIQFQYFYWYYIAGVSARILSLQLIIIDDHFKYFIQRLDEDELVLDQKVIRISVTLGNLRIEKEIDIVSNRGTHKDRFAILEGFIIQ